MPGGVNYSKREVVFWKCCLINLFPDCLCGLRKGKIFHESNLQFFNINRLIFEADFAGDAAFYTRSDVIQFSCKCVINFNCHTLVFSADVTPLGFVIVIPFLEVAGSDQIVGSTNGIFLVCLGDACVPLRESKELLD